MALDQYLSTPLLISALLLILTWLIINWFKENRKLPPGPWGLPILGYWPFIQTTHLDFTDLSKTYGNVFSFRTVGGRLIIVLNGIKTIKEVLINRADEFDGRPHGNNLVSWISEGIGISQEEGQSWSEQRRFFLQTAKNLGFGKLELEEKIHDELKSLLGELRDSNSKPVNFHLLICYAYNNIISDVLFNKKFDRNHTFSRNVSSMKQIVEIFTGVRHMLIGFPFDFVVSLPGQRRFQKGRDAIRKFTDSIVDELTKNFDPHHVNNYVDAYLQHKNELEKKGKPSSFNEARLKANALNLFFEGTESTGSTTTSLLIELSKHPDVQKKIQEELDTVVGRERLPSWIDRPNLPYLDATIQELYRVAALFLVTTMYSNFKETTIEGYRIPKRSCIVSNLYSINLDPKLYPNPKKFDPERFLNAEGKRIKHEGPFPFGLGKRACIGESLAQMEVFLVISCLLQSFSIPYATEFESIRVIPRD
ncbi:cytochrome P450 2J6 [Trichonephila clavata]|uniref:Cytochrome P450 2J6 n=1 Tax=Trichonephila clavata TaxID=2740835 RepID=A0A8X6GDU9_TRICU|nr:cytochrome P450 2J6 [Trichonephila clavata]